MTFDIDQFVAWLDRFHHPVLRILLVWALALFSLSLLRRLSHAIGSRTTGIIDAHLEARRIETLSSVFRYTYQVVILGLAVVLTLSEFGVSVAPILATAGVAGIAIGFGAQSLVKDFFTGLFLLLEDQVSEGDYIEAAGKAGMVERITLRHVRIRDFDGGLHYIPNSMITLVTNRTRGFAYAVIELAIPRSADLDRALEMMREVASSMREDRELAPLIEEGMDRIYVEKLEEAAVAVRGRIRVVPPYQARVRSEFLRRMKGVLDGLRQPTVGSK